MPRPNVIVCMCDQLRSFEVGCYGNRHVNTPNIDCLAAGGVRFATAVTNNPVCTPARSCLLSGQYSRTCAGMLGNVHDSPPNPARTRLVDPTIADVFRDHGYRTALIGKWHLDPQPQLVGFETAIYPKVEHRYYGQTYFTETGESFTVDEWGPDFEDGRLEQFLAGQGAEPFFLFYNLSLPHQPIGPGHMPEKYLGMYDPQKIPLRENTDSIAEELRQTWSFKAAGVEDRDFEKAFKAYREWWFKVYLTADFFWDFHYQRPGIERHKLPAGFELPDLTALYYGATTAVDDSVGAMMGKLERHGLTANTIVVFVSDHGDNLGSHGYFNKDMLLEESIRIPLIFHWPGQLAPQVEATRVAQIIDIAPTLYQLCEIETPACVQGRDLAPLLRGKGMLADENEAFIETSGGQIGVRTPTHLYGVKINPETREVANDRLYFFNLLDDPYQEHNMAGTNEEAELATRLRQRLLQWHDGTRWLEAGGR